MKTKQETDTYSDHACEAKETVPREKSKVFSEESVVNELANSLADKMVIKPECGCGCNDKDHDDELSREFDALQINGKEPTEGDDTGEFIKKGPPGVPTFYGDHEHLYKINEYHDLQQSETLLYQDNIPVRRPGMKSSSSSRMIYPGVKAMNNTLMSGGAILPSGPTPPTSPGQSESFSSLECQLAVLASELPAEQTCSPSDLNNVTTQPVMPNVAASPAYEWNQALSPLSQGILYPLSPESDYSSVDSPAHVVCGSPKFDEERLDDLNEIIQNDLENGERSEAPNTFTKQKIQEIAVGLQKTDAEQIVPSLPPPCSLQAAYKGIGSSYVGNGFPASGHAVNPHLPPGTTVNDEQSILFNPQAYDLGGFSQNDLSQHTPLMTAAPPIVGHSNSCMMGTTTSASFVSAQTVPGTGANPPMNSLPMSAAVNGNVMHAPNDAPGMAQTTAYIVNPTTAQQLILMSHPSPPQVVVVQSPQVPLPRKILQATGAMGTKYREILPKTPVAEGGQDVVHCPRTTCKAVPIKGSIMEQRPIGFEKAPLAQARKRIDLNKDDEFREKYLNQDKDGDSQLMIMVDNNKMEMVYAVVKRSKNIDPNLTKEIVNLQNNEKETALFRALPINPDIVCVLLMYYCDIQLQSVVKTRNGAVWWNPFHFCAHRGDALIDSLCLLLAAQKQDGRKMMDAKSTENWTPLHYAAMEHGQEKKTCIATIHTLIAEGADINVKGGCSGLTPFHCMVRTGDVLLVESVLDMLKPDVLEHTLMQKASANDETCLHFAVQLGIPDGQKALLVQLLLSRCPELMHTKMRYGGKMVKAQNLITKTENPKVWEVFSKARQNPSRLSPQH